MQNDPLDRRTSKKSSNIWKTRVLHGFEKSEKSEESEKSKNPFKGTPIAAKGTRGRTDKHLCGVYDLPHENSNVLLT